MPTENRSSNTEVVSELLPCPFCNAAMRVESNRDWHRAIGDHADDCVFTDSETMMVPASDAQRSLMVADWNRRAQPAPQSHPDPIAWMVGTAFWWTKEEAERDAAATGLPIVGLGPMTDAAEVERLRAALKFYADRDHFAEDIGSDWDSVSGEPANILWHEHEAWFVEDGSIARAALSGKSEQDQRLRIADPSAISNQIGNEG